EESVRCILPGVTLPLGKSGDYIVKLFKDKYDIDIDYLTQTKTLPVEGAFGSRVDQIIDVQRDSLEKFAEIKRSINDLYVTEIVESNQQHIYNERVYLKYIQRKEKALLKEGKIAKEDTYQMTKYIIICTL